MYASQDTASFEGVEIGTKGHFRNSETIRKLANANEPELGNHFSDAFLAHLSR